MYSINKVYWFLVFAFFQKIGFNYVHMICIQLHYMQYFLMIDI